MSFIAIMAAQVSAWYSQSMVALGIASATGGAQIAFLTLLTVAAITVVVAVSATLYYSVKGIASVFNSIKTWLKSGKKAPTKKGAVTPPKTKTSKEPNKSKDKTDAKPEEAAAKAKAAKKAAAKAEVSEAEVAKSEGDKAEASEAEVAKSEGEEAEAEVAKSEGEEAEAEAPKAEAPKAEAPKVEEGEASEAEEGDESEVEVAKAEAPKVEEGEASEAEEGDESEVEVAKPEAPKAEVADENPVQNKSWWQKLGGKITTTFFPVPDADYDSSNEKPDAQGNAANDEVPPTPNSQVPPPPATIIINDSAKKAETPKAKAPEVVLPPIPKTRPENLNGLVSPARWNKCTDEQQKRAWMKEGEEAAKKASTPLKQPQGRRSRK